MTFFEGGIRVITFVGGGYVPSDQRGSIREGFFHGTDWLPTFLGMIDENDDKKKKPKNESLLARISKDLQEKLYVPIAKRVALKLENKTDDYSKYLMNETFDGIDLSQWLLYNDASQNTHTKMPLSINNIDSDELESDVSIIYESELVANRVYKFMYLEAVPNSAFSEWCYFDSKTGQRSETTTNSVDTTRLLFDLTKDANETYNLMEAPSLRKTPILAATSKEMAIQLRDSYKAKITKKFGKNGLDQVIGNVTDYELEENEDVILFLWYEGQAFVYEYMTSPLYNNYLDCQEDIHYASADPANHDNAWSTYMGWEEFRTEFLANCEEFTNDLLLELYLTKYKDYMRD